jgi:acetyltransferase-like isoleucine patch superfamily enzyme
MEFGAGSAIPNPLLIKNAHYIKIGRNLQAWPGLRLEALVTKPTRIPQLIIEDDVAIGQNTQIISHCKVTIRKGAGIGPHCFIMDVGHPILDRTSDVPLAQRFTTEDSFVEIGEGALLGAGTVIMPNVRIGKGAVVGSNSVVRKSLPDNCVASGNPASVQLLYDMEQDRWLPAKPGR